MKKCILLTLLCLVMLGSAANATVIGSGLGENGTFLAQDDTHLYFFSTEVQKFIVMEKKSGNLKFYAMPNPDSYSTAVHHAIVRNGEVFLSFDQTLTDSDGSFVNSYGHITRFADGVFNEPVQVSDRSFWKFDIADDGMIWGIVQKNVDVYYPGITQPYPDYDEIVGTIQDDLAFTPMAQLLRHEGEVWASSTAERSEPFGNVKIDATGSVWFLGNYFESYGFFNENNKWYNALFKVNGDMVEKIEIPKGLCGGDYNNIIEFDNEGNLWFCSNGSESDPDATRLIKYDGKDFTCYDLPEGVTYINDFKFDEQGRIWILTWKSPIICMEDIENNIFTSYDHELLPHGNDVYKDMNHLLIDGETVYVIGGQQVKDPTTWGAPFKRPFLVTIKDGEVSYVEIEPEMNGKSVDAVSNVEAAEAAPAAMYDLQGHRLTEEPAKGVYIQNGKKVVK